jgi:hypothetical protein
MCAGSGQVLVAAKGGAVLQVGWPELCWYDCAIKRNVIIKDFQNSYQQKPDSRS